MRPSFGADVLQKIFSKKAVDSINGFDRLSAASTEKPLKYAVES